MNRTTRTLRNRMISGLVAGILSSSMALADDIYLDLGRGPVLVRVPAGYDPEVPAPLVFLLHGYGGSGAGQEAYMQFAPLVDEYGFFYLHPDGTINDESYRFWNATDVCCDFYNSEVDDSGYLRSFIDELTGLYNIDQRRIYFIGHSNGGFMSYRMACDHADTVAAIASLAGATHDDPADCTPIETVHVLQMHGTADNAIDYNGGYLFGNPYPGAVETVEMWAAYDGCVIEGDTSPAPLDLDTSLPGDETLVTRYATDCLPGGSAELWTIVGGGHVPALTDQFSRLVMDFFLSHPKADPCPSDLNDDGSVNIDDLFQVLGAWGPCDGCPEDLNGDIVVDIDDLFSVLGDWGPCE